MVNCKGGRHVFSKSKRFRNSREPYPLDKIKFKIDKIIYILP